MIDRVTLSCIPIAVISAACSSPPVTPSPAVPTPASPASAPAGFVEANGESAPVASSEVTASAMQPMDGVPADSSYPPGVQPVTDEEAKEADVKCKALKDKLVAEARKAGAGKNPVDAMMEALKNPPKVPGVDVARCIDLIRRDLDGYRAQTVEVEARTTLKRIVVGLASASSQDPTRLCPSAPPVPADLSQVRNAPWKSQSADWQAPGWKCARVDLTGAAQRFQYEVRMSPASHAYQIIARGFPVSGQPATELFIQGKIEGGKIQPSSEVLRRK